MSSEQTRLVMTASCLGLLLAWWAGCGSPDQRYRVLSFFIDGVPDPNASTLGSDDQGNPMFYMEHQPYAEENCAACHGGAGISGLSLAGFQQVSVDICKECHEEQVSLHPYMHGPVASRACLWCHDPHNSRYPHLLQEAPHRLCAQCHEQALLDPTVLEHGLEDSNCIDCHSGHGGTNPFFIIERPTPPDDLEQDEAGTEEPADDEGSSDRIDDPLVPDAQAPPDEPSDQEQAGLTAPPHTKGLWAVSDTHNESLGEISWMTHQQRGQW
ncbi:MAG: hypothetical protein HND57_05430 [Planctomycetes bacterium]|nr:hypothetical protein [Planctomycetota bacterium]